MASVGFEISIPGLENDSRGAVEPDWFWIVISRDQCSSGEGCNEGKRGGQEPTGSH